MNLLKINKKLKKMNLNIDANPFIPQSEQMYKQFEIDFMIKNPEFFGDVETKYNEIIENNRFPITFKRKYSWLFDINETNISDNRETKKIKTNEVKTYANVLTKN